MITFQVNLEIQNGIVWKHHIAVARFVEKGGEITVHIHVTCKCRYDR
jgi:hypothetical protein